VYWVLLMGEIADGERSPELRDFFLASVHAPTPAGVIQCFNSCVRKLHCYGRLMHLIQQASD
jgi:hypothetical protein